jgi:hypothetical protein
VCFETPRYAVLLVVAASRGWQPALIFEKNTVEPEETA